MTKQFGEQFGGGIKTGDGRTLYMMRKGQRVRFYDKIGNQVGPEHTNVAPAISYAINRGWLI